MTPSEARVFLELSDGPLDVEAVRAAYLLRVRAARLDRDPEGFVRLHAAFVALRQGDAAHTHLETARANLKAHPDSSEARWTLLSHLSYTDGKEAFSVLREGATRQPDDFLDELLLHFPEKVPSDLLARAGDGAAPARRLLIADAHASQARQTDALESLKSALAESHDLSPAILRLAVRLVLSLQAHAQLDAAGAALAMLKDRAGALGVDLQRLDTETATMMAVADELGHLGPSFPLDLRQAAALAAKKGDFERARYEARYATRLLSPGTVRGWRRRLKRETPTLATLLGLDLTEQELRPRGTPNFRIRSAIGISILICVVGLSFQIHAVKQSDLQFDKFAEALLAAWKKPREKTELEACADPSSDHCLRWNEQQACAHLSPRDCRGWRDAWMKKWRPGPSSGR